MPRVIIPRFIDSGGTIKYFVPRFVKIQRGDVVEWTNLDTDIHRLAFYEIVRAETGFSRPVFIQQLEPIGPNESQSMRFELDTSSRVDYYCAIHGNEIGNLVVYPANEETMSNTDRLEFLSRIFNITPPEPYKHLGSR